MLPNIPTQTFNLSFALFQHGNCFVSYLHQELNDHCITSTIENSHNFSAFLLSGRNLPSEPSEPRTFTGPNEKTFKACKKYT